MALVGLACCLGLCSAALLLWPGRVSTTRRRARWHPPDVLRRSALAAVAIAAAGVLLGLPWWLVAGAATLAAATVRTLPKRDPAPTPRQLRTLAGAMDLLATGLDAGLPLADAITAALTGGTNAWRPAWSEALTETAALLALGAEPAVAWQGAARCPELEGLAAAAELAAIGGVPLAEAARTTATELRARCRALGQRSAARAGLVMTAPLTLCFLPAFLCWGLAPVVIGLVDTLHIW